MKNKKIYIALSILLTFIIFIIFSFFIKNNNFKNLKTNSIEKNVDIKKYLDLALLDEYKARDTYSKIIEKFGPVKPFSNIVKAEDTHIKALEDLYKKYNISLPEKEELDIKVADTIKENCKIGVEAETLNYSLYKNSLIPNVIDYLDVVNVFTNLMNASQNNHLKAFERCK